MQDFAEPRRIHLPAVGQVYGGERRVANLHSNESSPNVIRCSDGLPPMAAPAGGKDSQARRRRGSRRDDDTTGHVGVLSLLKCRYHMADVVGTPFVGE